MPPRLSYRTDATRRGPLLPSTAVRSLLTALSAAAAIVIIDQMTKYVVVERMNLREVGTIDFLPFLNFQMAWNRGVNFGLLSSESDAGRWAIIIFTAALSAALIAAAAWSRRRAVIIGVGIAAGGALGNLIDRFTYGAVADFLNVSGFGIRNPWSFNVADVAVFAGFALVLLFASRSKSPPESGAAA